MRCHIQCMTSSCTDRFLYSFIGLILKTSGHAFSAPIRLNRITNNSILACCTRFLSLSLIVKYLNVFPDLEACISCSDIFDVDLSQPDWSGVKTVLWSLLLFIWHHFFYSLVYIICILFHYYQNLAPDHKKYSTVSTPRKLSYSWIQDGTVPCKYSPVIQCFRGLHGLVQSRTPPLRSSLVAISPPQNRPLHSANLDIITRM